MNKENIEETPTGKKALNIAFSFRHAVSMMRMHDLAALVHTAREDNDGGDE